MLALLLSLEYEIKYIFWKETLSETTKVTLLNV